MVSAFVYNMIESGRVYILRAAEEVRKETRDWDSVIAARASLYSLTSMYVVV